MKDQVQKQEENEKAELKEIREDNIDAAKRQKSKKNLMKKEWTKRRKKWSSILNSFPSATCFNSSFILCNPWHPNQAIDFKNIDWYEHFRQNPQSSAHIYNK